MGKVKRNRNKPRNKNPISNPNEHNNPQDEILESEITPNELSINAAKQQMQSANQEDKLCGLQTLSVLLESKEYEKVLVEKSVVRVAAPLLVDETPTVRNVTSGMLRNFSVLGLEACEYLVGQDIMTPLIEFFKKYADNWVPKKTNTGKLDEDADTFLHCVHLLWNLCESSGVAVKYFNDSNIISILTRCLEIETFGGEMVAAILHCLFVITEDNPKAINDMRTLGEERIQSIFMQQDETSVVLLLRILAAGIILNIQSNNLTCLPTNVVRRILSTLNTVLTVDLRQSCNKISSVLPLADAKPNASNYKQNQNVESEASDVRHLIDAQQIAVEIMTNLCSCEDQEDDAEMDSVSDMDSEMEYDSMNDGTCGSDSLFAFDKLHTEVTDCIASNNIVSKILAKTILPPENVLKNLEDSEIGQNIYKRLCILQARSLLCMNNLISNLQIEILGGPEGLYKIWIDTGKRILKEQQPYNAEEIMESASAVMRASLDRLKNDLQESNGSLINSALIKELTLHDIKFLLEGIEGCTFPEIRANLTRMVGNVGLILVKGGDDSSTDLLLTIANFVLDRMLKETECWLLAEVIDTIMDLFSEDETDTLAQRVGLINKLNVIKPAFKSKVRQQKKTLGDHSAIVGTVVANLPRFIEYKRQRVANIK